jgi:hypothetical protein
MDIRQQCISQPTPHALPEISTEIFSKSGTKLAAKNHHPKTTISPANHHNSTTKNNQLLITFSKTPFKKPRKTKKNPGAGRPAPGSEFFCKIAS